MNLRDKLIQNLSYDNETWEDVVAHTLSPSDLNKNIDSYCLIPSFTLWTNNNVYTDFTDSDDGTFIMRVNRNPPQKIFTT